MMRKPFYFIKCLQMTLLYIYPSNAIKLTNPHIDILSNELDLKLLYAAKIEESDRQIFMVAR